MGADKVIGLPLIGQIPSHWRVVDFGDVLDNGTRNGIYKPKAFHGRGVKIVNMGELFAHPRLRPVEMRRVELSDDELTRSKLESGDLLFARRSLVAEGAGKCSIVLDVDEPTTFESSIIRARPDHQQADSLFLYYLFSSPFGAYSLGSILRHVAVAGITGSDLVNLPIPLPPLAEQRAIAHVLGILDDKIELNQRINETLEEVARAIFKSWFVDFDPVCAKMEGRKPAGMSDATATLFPDSFDDSALGRVPVGWKVGNFGDIISKRSEQIGNRQATVLSTVASGQLIRSDEQFMKRVYSKDISKYLVVEQGDFAYNPSRINIGSIGMLKEPMVGAVSPVYVVARPATSYRWFLEFSLRQTRTKEWINTLASGSVRQALSYDDFASIPCIIPPEPVVLQFDKAWTQLQGNLLAHSAQSRNS